VRLLHATKVAKTHDGQAAMFNGTRIFRVYADLHGSFSLDWRGSPSVSWIQKDY